MKNTQQTKKAQLDKMNEEDLRILPLLTKVLLRTNKNKPIFSNEIIQGFTERKKKYSIKSFGSARLRKIINYFRVNAILPVISTSNGYYLSYDEEDLMAMIKSLEGRAEAIQAAADGLRTILNNKKLIDKANQAEDLFDMIDKEYDLYKKSK